MTVSLWRRKKVVGCACALAIALHSASARAAGEEPDVAIALRIDNAEIGPMFAVSMSAAGLVEHSGYSLGVLPAMARSVSRARRRDLVALLKRWRYFEMRSNYGCGVDVPYRRIGAVLNGHRWGVKFCLDGTDVRPEDAQALLHVWWGAMAALSRDGKAVPWESDRDLMSKR